jgi:membrane associated rhomboid family serine protease
MNDPAQKNKLMFNAYSISRRNEWYRFITCGLIHADFMHLLFNMYSLYSIGMAVEISFKKTEYFGHEKGMLFYILLYIGGLIMSEVYSFFTHKDNMHYNSLGASGAVCSVIFSFVLLYPTAQLNIFFIPLPGWIFGILFLAISWVLARRSVGFIAHDAHFWGAVWGFLFPIVLKPDLWYAFLGNLKMGLMYHS